MPHARLSRGVSRLRGRAEKIDPKEARCPGTMSGPVIRQRIQLAHRHLRTIIRTARGPQQRDVTCRERIVCANTPQARGLGGPIPDKWQRARSITRSSSIDSDDGSRRRPSTAACPAATSASARFQVTPVRRKRATSALAKSSARGVGQKIRFCTSIPG